jgi:hypothetical protein
MDNFPQILKNIPTERYVTDTFSFDYPGAAKVIEFKHGGEGLKWRLLINLAGTEFSYDIKLVKLEHSAGEMARAMYDNASRGSSSEDLPPFQLLLEKTKGWRYRYRFVDGFRANLLIEVVLLEHPAGDCVCQLQYAVTPEKYEQGLIVYELIVRTFDFKIE